MEIITGTFFLNENKYQFTLNNFYVKVAEPNSLYMDDFKDIDQIESIKGITSDGRDILLIQCSFIKNIIFCNSFNIQCFILSNSLTPFDFMIDRITFYSPAINTFFSPKYARQIVDNKDSTGEFTLRIAPFKNTEFKFDYNNVECELNVERYINLKQESSEIGTLKSIFSFNFPNPIFADIIPHYSIAFFDFFSFLNCNKSIPIDKIVLYSRDKNNKRIKTAYAYIHLQPSNYKNTALDSITIDDIESEKIGALFSKISNLRKLDNRIHLYFPKEKSELYYIDPAKWLLLAICFEGLFSEVYPDFKSKTKASFTEVKNQMLDKINELEYNSGKKKDYFEKLKRQIEIYDGILEEKFNYVLTNNRTPLENILSFNMAEYHTVDKENYGNIYMNYRNKLAHGNIESMTNKELAVSRLIRPMIYLLLLNDLDFSLKNLTSIIHKLFK